MKVKLRRYEVNELMNVIKALNGRVESAKDNDGKVIGLLEKPFEFDLKARLALAMTARKLAHEVDSYAEAQKGFRAEVRKDADGNPLSKEANDLAADEAVQKFMYEETEVEVHATDAAGLKIDTNKLSPRVIMALLPMLTGDLVADQVTAGEASP